MKSISIQLSFSRSMPPGLSAPVCFCTLPEDTDLLLLHPLHLSSNAHVVPGVSLLRDGSYAEASADTILPLLTDILGMRRVIPFCGQRGQAVDLIKVP